MNIHPPINALATALLPRLFRLRARLFRLRVQSLTRSESEIGQDLRSYAELSNKQLTSFYTLNLFCPK